MSHALSKADTNQVAEGRAVYDSALITGTIHCLSKHDLVSVVISLLYSMLERIRTGPEDRKPFVQSEWLLRARRKRTVIYTKLIEFAEKEIRSQTDEMHVTKDGFTCPSNPITDRLDIDRQPSNGLLESFPLNNLGTRMVISFLANHFIERYFSPICDLNAKVSPLMIKAREDRLRTRQDRSRARDRHNGMMNSFKSLTVG